MTAVTEPGLPLTPAGTGARGPALRLFDGSSWTMRFALAGVFGLVLLALLAPVIAPHGPNAISPIEGLQSPRAAHLFGTDQLGRDIFSRTVYGTRIDLLIGFVGVIVPLIVGTVVGLVSGYRGGWIDAVVGRLIDVVTAFPFLVLVIAIVAVLGPGLRNFFVAVSLVSWVSYARLVRGQVLATKQLDYVVAARSLGFSAARVAVRHLLPNVIAPAIVFAASDFVLDIVAGASLGFFGLGAPPATAEWGVMIAEGRNFIVTAPWVVLFPGLAIMLVSFFFGLLGDALADAVRRV